MSTALTPAQAAIWTPPVGQIEGIPQPGTIVNPFIKQNMQDTAKNRLTLAWCAAQPLAKQGLYAGLVGSAQELAPRLSEDAQASLCQQLFAEGYDILLPVDDRMQDIDITMIVAATVGLKAMPTGNPVTGSVTNGDTFIVSENVMDFQPAAWAIAALTPAPNPGASNPIGAYIPGGIPDGVPGARYENAAGSKYNGASPGNAQVQQGGATYAIVKLGSTLPGDPDITIEWMLIIPAAS